MANGNGPWGGGNGPEDDRPKGKRDSGPQSQIPEIDEVLRKGSERLRVIMGGGGGGRPPQSQGPALTPGGLALGALGALLIWGYMAAYTVRPDEQGVEFFLGKDTEVTGPGLHFVAWPLGTG